MRLNCDNGYYKFFPSYVGEIMIFEIKNGVKLYPVKDYYTFKALAEFPNYSLKGQPITGGITAVVNYAGTPEEVLAKNKLTYDLKNQKIAKRASVAIQKLDYAKGAYSTFPTLPQAFALDEDKQVKGFTAFIDVKMNTCKLERLEYENI